MVIILSNIKGKVYEVIDDPNYSKVLDKLNWLISHLEDLGYMLVKETSHVFNFADSRGWRYVVMLADDYVGKMNQK